jgi:glycosyltransferase involved in cell wall biosynthesis
MLAFVGQLMRLGPRLARDLRPDAVIASSTYPLDVMPARRIAVRCGARLIFEVHDLWPLSPIELGGMSPRHPFIRMLQWAEDYAYRTADRVVSMLPKASGHMQSRGMAAHKFAYIPNGIEIADWGAAAAVPPEPHRHVLNRLRGEGYFVVAYAGAHGIANALNTLIEAARLISDQRVAVLLIGQGPEKEALRRLATAYGISNVHFLPSVAREHIPALLAAMDALYIGLQRTSLFRFGISPNKLMDYMMAAKPVIQAIDAGNDMVADSGCGISLAPEDPRALADAIAQLAGLPAAERAAMGQRGREHVRRHHDYRVLAARFLDALR